MNKALPITLVALLAAGGLMFATNQSWGEDAEAPARQDDQTDAQAAADATPAPSFPAGIKVDDDPEEERPEILNTLEDLTEAVFVKDSFDDVVERLLDQDRNRIGDDGFAEKKFDDLNAKAAALRSAWKSKYGEDIEIEGEQAFTKLAVIVGKIDDPDVVAGGWPVPPVTASAEPVPAAAKETEGNADPDLNSNVEKGRGVAIATIPASHGLPALNISLIQELQGWRIDIPNSITGQQLHDNLLKHLGHVADMRSDWPADKNEAALLAAHHVLLGVYGVDMKPADQKKRSAPRQ